MSILCPPTTAEIAKTRGGRKLCIFKHPFAKHCPCARDNFLPLQQTANGNEKHTADGNKPQRATLPKYIANDNTFTTFAKVLPN